MAEIETFNTQSRVNAPAILESLSELEKRDKDSKGQVQSGAVAGAGLSDPRGYAVLNTTGNTVGKVVDLYVDPHTREPFFALMSLGGHTLGVGNRQVLVGFASLEIQDGKHVIIQHAIA